MPKSQSRPARWQAACAKGREAIGKIEDLKAELAEAFTELNELKSEYEDWQSNLPENLAQSALGEKLDAVVGLDLDWAEDGEISDAESLLDEAENLDLPRGFGKD
jgi:hypothetical protein